MNGIRTYSERHFGDLFGPLFELLRGSSWLALPSSFQYPAEWVDASTYDEAEAAHTSGPIRDFEAEVALICDVAPMTRTTWGHSAATDIFPRFAAAVSDDWSSIFAVPGPVADPRQWLERYYAATDRAQYLDTHARVVFLSVDSAFWECFTNQSELLDLLWRHFGQTQVAAEHVQLTTNLGYL